MAKTAEGMAEGMAEGTTKRSTQRGKVEHSPTRQPSRPSLTHLGAGEPLQVKLAADLPTALLRSALLSWYRQQGRSLPWRNLAEHPDKAYRIWISEIMLQQTQVKTVLPYYQRWLERFPTVAHLAAAELQSVLKAWEGLGYYSRARNLHRAAQQVAADHGGRVPQDLAAVLALPGVGRTTAGGILSSAFNLPVAILDGNVKRVLARLVALEQPVSRSLPQLWEVSEAILDPDNPRDFNQALMDLGATLCTPRNPGCLICPWREACRAYNLGLQSELPMKEASAPIPQKQIGVGVVWNRAGEILIDRRKAEGLLGGLWEFPGGKIEAGETPEDCIRRELQEELAIEVEVGPHLMTVNHAYTHFKVALQVYHCLHVGGEPRAIACDEIRWVTLAEMDQFPFPKANTTIIEALRQTTNPFAEG
jgi:A/G-specific adenine glycosylase